MFKISSLPVKGLLMAAALCLTLPLASQAATYTEAIIVVDDVTTTVQLPDVELEKSHPDFALVVQNPTSTTAQFQVPELGIDEYIPWFSEKTIPVDLSKVGEDRKFSYIIKDARGSRNYDLAHGDVVVGKAEYPQIVGNNLDHSVAILEDMVMRNSKFREEDYIHVQKRDDYSVTPRRSTYYDNNRTIKGYW